MTNNQGNAQNTSDSYTVYRFTFRGKQNGRVVKTGLTLEQAQEWCSRDDTHGKNWFDGYKKD